MKLKSCILLAYLLLLPTRVFSQQWKEDRPHSPTWRFSDRSGLLKNLDYSVLEEELRSSYSSISEARLPGLVRRNFEFVFLNQVNKDRFLAMPEPERVLQTVVSILQQNRQLHSLIEGGGSVAENPSQRERMLLKEVAGAARRLRDDFMGTFLELKSTKYSIRLPSRRRAASPFQQYLQEADLIRGQLNRQIARYFLNESPGSVLVSEYQNHSIAVLAEALIKLSDLTEKRLQQ